MKKKTYFNNFIYFFIVSLYRFSRLFCYPLLLVSVWSWVMGLMSGPEVSKDMWVCVLVGMPKSMPENTIRFWLFLTHSFTKTFSQTFFHLLFHTFVALDKFSLSLSSSCSLLVEELYMFNLCYNNKHYCELLKCQ